MTGISGLKSSVTTNYLTAASYAAHGAASSLTFGSGSAAAISYEPFGGMAQVALANGYYPSGQVACGTNNGNVRRAHRSVLELESAIKNYLALNNQSPKPFIWTKTADEILASLARFCQRTSEAGH